MASLTVENYVKAIYLLCNHRTGQPSPRATSPNIFPSRRHGDQHAAHAIESSLADYQAYSGVKLTPAGQNLALRIIRRHRLIETFLVKTLGLSWDEVHAEAENLEHAVSDSLVDRIDAFLDFPKVDPHGDPIPTSAGEVSTDQAPLLLDQPAGTQFKMQRVLHQSADFLRYLDKIGLVPSARGEVISNDAIGKVILLSIAGQEQTVAYSIAENIRIEVME